MHYRLFTALVLSLNLVTLGLAEAANCPVDLHQNNAGYWTSNDYPGWKSNEAFPLMNSLNSANFSGAVYAPDKKRIACVYHDISNQWVVLLSNIYHPINSAELKGKWRYDANHHDYVCEKPIAQLKDCQFKASH